MNRFLCFVFIFAGLFSVTCSSAKQYYGSRYEHYHSLGFSYVQHLLQAGGSGALALTYSPRINIYRASRTTSISVGTNLSVGYNLRRINTTPTYQSQYMFEFPVIFHLNFGYGATSNKSFNFGGYIGAGYAISSMKNIEKKYDDTLYMKGLINGLNIDVGCRFKISTYLAGTLSGYGIFGLNDAVITGLRLQIGYMPR